MTGPRQYIWSRDGAAAVKVTRKATASERDSLERLPGDIVSDRPVVAYASCGMPHSGPCTRGNSTKMISDSGMACSSRMPAMRRRGLSPSAPVCMCTQVARTTINVASMYVAVGMLCE
jgi:hypothetical protein